MGEGKSSPCFSILVGSETPGIMLALFLMLYLIWVYEEALFRLNLTYNLVDYAF